MTICITKSLSNAVEVAKNLFQKEKLNPAQEKTLSIALSLMMLCKKFFDINTNRHELEVIKTWLVNSEEVIDIFLAKKEDKYFLYCTFIDSGAKSLGIFVPDQEKAFIEEMDNQTVLKYFNALVSAI